jgi:hypothetical protein
MIVYLSGNPKLVGSRHQFRIFIIQHITKYIFRNTLPEKIGLLNRAPHRLEEVSDKDRLHIVADFEKLFVFPLRRVRLISELVMQNFTETASPGRTIERMTASYITNKKIESVLRNGAPVLYDHENHLLSAFAVASMESDVVMAFEFNS